MLSWMVVAKELNLKPIFQIVKKARGVGAVLTALWAAKKTCSAGGADALMAQIGDMETSRLDVDLNGWEYNHVVSRRSGATYFYYHMASRRPDAPKLVLVHGLFLDGRNFLFFDSLADYFELFALQLPHQSSFYKGYLEDFVDLLQDFIDAQAFERIHLCGISLGGMISMKYAGGSPKTPVDALYLISTDTAKSMAALEKQRQNARRALKVIGDRDDLTICLIDELRKRRMKTASSEEQEVLKLFALKHPSFYRQVLHAAVNNDKLLPIHNITAPTLIVHGDADKTLPFASAKHLVDVIPDATMAVIGGGDHDIAYTRAKEVVPLLARHYLTHFGSDAP